MNELFRPATLGEILDRTASLYRSWFLVLFGIASVPSAILLAFLGSMVLVFAGMGRATPEAGVVAGLFVGLLSLVLVPLLIGAQSLTGAALCHAAGSLVYGEKITIRHSFRAAWSRGWRYVGLYLLMLLIIFGVPFTAWSMFFGALTAVAVGSGQGGPGVLLGAFAVLLILGLAVYVFWMLARLCLAFPIAVIEQAGVTMALKRAASLSRGTRGRMLVLFLLGLVLSWVASLLVTVPILIAVALVPGLNTPQHAQVVGSIAIIGMYGSWFVVQALTMPVYAIALVLFYYDQRVRQEGFDIEILMRQAGMAAETTVLPQNTPGDQDAARGSAHLVAAQPIEGEPVADQRVPADPAVVGNESSIGSEKATEELGA